MEFEEGPGKGICGQMFDGCVDWEFRQGWLSGLVPKEANLPQHNTGCFKKNLTY